MPLPDGLAVPKPKNKPKPSSGSRSKPPQTRAQPPRSRPNPAPPSGPPQYGPGPVPTVSPPPRAPSVPAYLSGDDVYQQALRGGKRSLKDFLSDLTRRRGEAGTNFTQTTETLERDRGLQLERLKDEFASRGLLHSGLYAEEQGRFQQDFQTQLAQLTQANKQLLADLLSQETNFRREQQLAMEIARQEALARRAAEFNI